MDLKSAVGNPGPQWEDFSGHWSRLGNAGPRPGSSGADWAPPQDLPTEWAAADVSCQKIWQKYVGKEYQKNVSRRCAKRNAKKYVKKNIEKYDQLHTKNM